MSEDLERQLKVVTDKLNAISARASAITARCDRFNRWLVTGARTPRDLRKLTKKADRQERLLAACVEEGRALVVEKSRLIAAIAAGK